MYNRLIELCTDICKRNGKTKLLWLGDKAKTLNYAPKSDEMILTVHRWFANKSCPGNWMYARMGDLASKVTAALGSKVDSVSPPAITEGKELYRVRKVWSDAKSQKGAYKILSNAKKCADANPGYSVLTAKGLVFILKNIESIRLFTATRSGRFLLSISAMAPGTEKSSS